MLSKDFYCAEKCMAFACFLWMLVWKLKIMWNGWITVQKKFVIKSRVFISQANSFKYEWNFPRDLKYRSRTNFSSQLHHTKCLWLLKHFPISKGIFSFATSFFPSLIFCWIVIFSFESFFSLFFIWLYYFAKKKREKLA